MWLRSRSETGVWNLYFIATSKNLHGSGVGTVMIEAVEHHLQQLGPDRARVLIVETSSTDQYRDARAFYARRGFDAESEIRDFYGPGDNKLTF